MMIDFTSRRDWIQALIIGAPMIAAVGIFWPIQGAVTRLQADFAPRTTTDCLNSRSSGVWNMLKRVRRVEGWSGLFKGAYVTLAVIGATVISPRLDTTKELWAPGVFQIAKQAACTTFLLTLLYLPSNIILVRSIITPFRLPYNPVRALRILLSDREFTAPYTLYCTPGVLMVNILQNIPFAFIARSSGIPVGLDIMSQPRDMDARRIAICLLLQVGIAIILTPLDVLGVRLSAQPNAHGTDKAHSRDRGTKDSHLSPAGDVLPDNSAEGILAQRPRGEPYMGMVDCARKMIREEGIGSLYKGWWWVLMGGVVKMM